MTIKYDEQADAIYIYLTNQPYAYGNDLDETRRIDYSSDGKPRGIELLCVSQGIDLEGLPMRVEIEHMLSESVIGKQLRILA